MIKIYTKTGDKGQTSLFGGKRVSKAELRVETYGTVDELNGAIGVVLAHLRTPEKGLQKELELIQHDLFAIGAALANPESSALPYLVDRVTKFEKCIDQMTETLPTLRNFILPGGGKTGALLHQARTICRRTERRLVALHQEAPVDGYILQYFNRLSDLFFTMARYANFLTKKKETIWVKQ